MAITNAKGGRLGIGALSARTGCKVETIRYYERVGLMPQPARSEGGHRLYEHAHVQRLGFIRRARELGFTLDQVRSLLGLADGERADCAAVEAVTRRHLDDVRGRIADLRRIEATLAELADACAEGVTPECPVLEVLSVEPSGTTR